MNCKSCGKPITCGCQKARANDGSTVHKTCLHEYNTKIAKVKTDVWGWYYKDRAKLCQTGI